MAVERLSRPEAVQLLRECLLEPARLSRANTFATSWPQKGSFFPMPSARLRQGTSFTSQSVTSKSVIGSTGSRAGKWTANGRVEHPIIANSNRGAASLVDFNGAGFDLASVSSERAATPSFSSYSLLTIHYSLPFPVSHQPPRWFSFFHQSPVTIHYSLPLPIFPHVSTAVSKSVSPRPTPFKSFHFRASRSNATSVIQNAIDTR